MKIYPIRFLPEARRNLIKIGQNIFKASLSEVVVERYLNRILKTIQSLEVFPERGQKRDTIEEGLRSIPFERKLLILYRISKDEVLIVRIYYGGKNYPN